MGIHEAAVRLGLSYTSNQEAEWKLARFIEKKFRKAAELFEKKFKDISYHRSFLDCLRDVWVEKEGRNYPTKQKFYIDDPFLKKYFVDLCGKEKPIEVLQSEQIFGETFGECYHVGEKYVGMAICIGALENSKEVTSFRKALGVVIGTVYHECDHIYNPSQSGAVEDFETALLNFMDDAEVRAHSKQIALVFHSAFPGKRFNLRILKDYVGKRFKPSEKTFKLLKYLELMRNPSVFQTKSQEINDYIQKVILPGGRQISKKSLNITFRKYMNFITYFVDYINKGGILELKEAA
ncbi:hypothetical protein HYU14_03365 [Candidatus Woesearchaeota archaeon]|nr:hypothetical protein [Candidatus Woesearchaeota archaeon]